MSAISSVESKQEDYEIVKNVLGGNKDAFSRLQNKYQKIIASLIRRMVQDEDDIDDLTQEAFIKAYNALDRFQFSYTFSSWLFKIASNNCIDFLRKKRFQTVSINQPIGDREDGLFIEIEDRENIPDLSVLSQERKKALNEAINSLPENYRKIIKLRHEEELDYKEISKLTGQPLGTVKAHLFRARKMMLDKLKKNPSIFSNA